MCTCMCNFKFGMSKLIPLFVFLLFQSINEDHDSNYSGYIEKEVVPLYCVVCMELSTTDVFFYLLF